MSEENIGTINKKIWNMADVLRDDGVSNIDYLEQITYLLFFGLVGITIINFALLIIICYLVHRQK